MSKHPNVPLKTVWICGLKVSTDDGSILIKPDVDLIVESGDKLALMFYSVPPISGEKICVSLTPEGLPLSDIFDTDNQMFPYPLENDGTVTLADKGFVMLIVKDQLSSQQSIRVKARWKDLNPKDDIVTYPPEMEIKVKG